MGGDSGSDDDGGGDSAYTTRPGEEGWGDPDPDTRTATNPYGTFGKTTSGGLNPMSADVGRTYNNAMNQWTGKGSGMSDQAIENNNRMSAAREEGTRMGTNQEERFDNVIPGVSDEQNTGRGYNNLQGGVVPGSFVDFNSASLSIPGLVVSGLASTFGAPMILGKALGMGAEKVAGALGVNPQITLDENGVGITTGATGPVAEQIGFSPRDLETRDDERGTEGGQPNITDISKNNGLMGGFDPSAPRNSDGSIKYDTQEPENPPNVDLGDDEPLPPFGASGRGAVDPRSTMVQSNISLEEEEEEALVSQRDFRRGNNSLFSNGRRGYV